MYYVVHVSIKSLKKNQTRDPSGMINELLLPGVMGTDMKKAVLCLMNGVKNTGYFPPFMQMADICTIFKSGSRLEMKNDRGVFILGVLKKAFDKMIYENWECLTQMLVHKEKRT